MKKSDAILAAKAAIVALAEIKAATEAFEQGEASAFDALDAIVVAVEAYRLADQSEREAA